jgi:predicted TIM-barrel fold metal-dependent hydrolase
MPPPSTRRDFLHQSAALGLAAATSSLTPTADEKPVLAIIDTHHHQWDLGKFKLPWLAGEQALNRSYLTEDYLAAIREIPERARPGEIPAKVVKSLYMEVDVAPEQQQQEADYVIDLCKRQASPMVGAVISGRPAAKSFPAYIKRFQKNPYIKGVRQVLHGSTTPAGYCLDKQFMAGTRLLGELGMSFDLCMRSAELGDACKLVEGCPDTRFVLDHCGGAQVQKMDRQQWQKDIAKLAARPNIVCKVSGIIASAQPGKWKAEDLAPIVNHTLDSFGPDRVLFGGDWPVCTLAASFAQWVEALRSIVRNRPEAEQRKLFHDNAVRFYGLV